MAVEHRLVNARTADDGGDGVVINSRADLHAGQEIRPGGEGEVEGLVVVVVLDIQDEVVARAGRLVGAAIADFKDVAQVQLAGGNFAVKRNTDVVRRDDAAAILEIEHGRTAHGGLEPGAVMIRGVVVADRRVVAADVHVEVIVQVHLEQQAFDLDAEVVFLAAGLDHGLAEHAHLFGKLRGDEDVKLTERERVVVSLHVVRMIRHVAEAVELELRKGFGHRRGGHLHHGGGGGGFGFQIADFALRAFEAVEKVFNKGGVVGGGCRGRAQRRSRGQQGRQADRAQVAVTGRL